MANKVRGLALNVIGATLPWNIPTVRELWLRE
jgi:hypothetical protein